MGAHKRGLALIFFYQRRSCKSANLKPHPSKPHPCNMPQAKTEVALQFSECCAAEVALQHWLFCSVDVILTKSCAAASKKLQRNIEKAALQKSGAFLLLACGFEAPTFRHPLLGPAEQKPTLESRAFSGLIGAFSVAFSQGQKKYPKNLCDKDFAELSGELSSAICLVTPCLIGYCPRIVQTILWCSLCDVLALGFFFGS